MIKIIDKQTYRSEGRKINQTDDMIKLTLIMSRIEFYELKNKIKIESNNN